MLTVFIASVALFPSSIAFATANTLPTNISAKDIDGTQMVYMKSDGDWDVYYYNLQNGETRQVTDEVGAQGFPAVSGNYVVWQDNRTYQDQPQSLFDIYLYDLTTGQEQKINQHTGYNQEVDIAGNHVVWLDNSSGYSNIYLYDISTGKETKITNDKAQAFGVKVYGDQVVWMDGRNGNFDIYTYNLKTNTETQVTSGDSKQSEPQVIDNMLVWHDYRSGVRQVYAYNLKTGTEKPISTDGQNSTILAVGNNGQIAFREEGDAGRLVLYDAAQDTTSQFIGVDANSTAVILDNGNIYWGTDGAFETARIADVTLPYSAVHVPSSSDTGGMVGAGTSPSVDDSWTPVRGEGVELSTDDQLFTLRIPAGDRADSLQVRLVATDSWSEGLPKGYQNLTSYYSIEKRGILGGPVEIEFDEPDLQSANLDKRKLVIFGWDDTTKMWTQVKSKVSRFNGKVEIEGDQLSSYVLTYFNAPFTDLKNHWSKSTIEALAAHGVIQGYADNRFMPDNSITRAEFVKLVVSALDLQENLTSDQQFSDTQGHWSESYVLQAAQAGLVTGYNGNFRPDSSISRQEMVTILIRAMVYVGGSAPQTDESALTPFTDAKQIDMWAQKAMQVAVTEGIIQGSNGQLNPLGNATRAESAKVISNLLRKMEL